ncbi:hypothetical protein FB451DRAFT_1407570 [Mycena latifolia]|nr:hypothetical protein FB451DRAFT_1407570 [Mycena latifolia]
MMQDCEFEELIKSDDLSPSQHVYQLNDLRFVSRTMNERFFEAFPFPQLNSLNIWAESTNWSPHILLDLQARSNFTLTYLERIYSQKTSSEDALFKAFTYDLKDPLPPFALRQLKSLSIAEDNDDLNGTLIADMVESGLFEDEDEARLDSACVTGFVVDHSNRG